jgi:hypothetical protein
VKLIPCRIYNGIAESIGYLVESTIV